jgi:hypothetical protein
MRISDPVNKIKADGNLIKMPRDENGRFVKASRQRQREALEKGRQRFKQRNTESSEPSSERQPSPVRDHDYVSFSADEIQVAVEEVASTENEKEEDNWRVGRRVVDLGILADGLKKCGLCGQPLYLNNCVGERKFGLAHVLLVECTFPECGLVNDVPTGTKHKTSSGGYAWDVNTKLAAGIVLKQSTTKHCSATHSQKNTPQKSRYCRIMRIFTRCR